MYLDALPSTSVYSHLIEYTSRQVTYNSDASNAFRGVFARSSCDSYWGILMPIGCEAGTKPPRLNKSALLVVCAGS
jgi:hypothetical protein